MNIKKIAMLAAMAICTGIYAKGVYFVSGGDFRKWDFKYTVKTTENNQEVMVSPTRLKTLSTVSADFEYPWSLKTGGNEYVFDYFANIGMSAADLSSRGASNIPPFSVTYPAIGEHTVKMYNTHGNVFRAWFENDPNITQLFVSWDEFAPVTGTTRQGPSVGVRNCANLRTFVYGNPILIPADSPRNAIEKLAFSQLPSIERFEIKHPEFYRSMGDFAFSSNNLTQIDLPNVTNVGNFAFFTCPSLTNVSMASAKKLGKGAFNKCGSLESAYFPMVEEIGIDAITSEGSFMETINVREMNFQNLKDAGKAAFTSNGVYTVYFPSVTNIQNSAFKWLPNATNAVLPNLEIAGGWCFMAAYYLKTLRISEKVRKVEDNAFYNTFKRVKVNGVARSEEGGTIEFITSASDFVAAWNNHAVLPKWFGPAVAIEGNDNEATLLPFTGKRGSTGARPAYYFTADNFPKPTRLVRIQPEE